jgi:hypothetical protein
MNSAIPFRHPLRRTTVQLVRSLTVVLTLLSTGAAGGNAQEPGGVQGAFLKQSALVQERFGQFARAIPQEKYAARPVANGRSIAEWLLHLAVGNYGTLRAMGGMVPADIQFASLEKSTTDKTAIISTVERSFKALNDHVRSIRTEDLGRPAAFGNLTVLDLVVVASNAQHEILGGALATAQWSESLRRSSSVRDSA